LLLFHGCIIAVASGNIGRFDTLLKADLEFCLALREKREKREERERERERERESERASLVLRPDSF